MVASHFGFYCAEVLKIKDAVTGDTVPMLVNKAQTYLQAQAEAQIEEMGMVGLMVLKGRQVGCTQWVAGPVLPQGEPVAREAGLRARAWPAALRMGQRKLYDRLALDRAVDALSRVPSESPTGKFRREKRHAGG